MIETNNSQKQQKQKKQQKQSLSKDRMFMIPKEPEPIYLIKDQINQKKYYYKEKETSSINNNDETIETTPEIKNYFYFENSFLSSKDYSKDRISLMQENDEVDPIFSDQKKYNTIEYSNSEDSKKKTMVFKIPVSSIINTYTYIIEDDIILILDTLTEENTKEGTYKKFKFYKNDDNKKYSKYIYEEKPFKDGNVFYYELDSNKEQKLIKSVSKNKEFAIFQYDNNNKWIKTNYYNQEGKLIKSLSENN
ncbi:hypothetical protein [Candidatus Phytoplasma pini]|nr:hypothetical protein [Candidatus Phytoplasma pini]